MIENVIPNSARPDGIVEADTRVLMFCSQFAPAVGGAEVQAEKLAKSLLANGVDVRILTPRIDDDSPDHEVVQGLPVRRFRLSDLSARRPGVHGIGVINAPWILLQIMWHVWQEAGRVDVVHCHVGGLQSVAAACAARLRGLPVICKAAMAGDRSDLGEAAKNGVTGRMVAWVGRVVFTRWVATTSAVLDALRRAGVEQRRIVVIPNGVAPLPARGESVSPVRRFLYLGRLSTNADRDVPGLLLAFDRLADDVDYVELAIVGGGDLLSATRALASACRHARRIRVTGQADAATWLAWADCFVLPSRREGMSNALLEAMAAGLPCIANDIPPNREVLANGAAGVLVNVGSANDLYAAMSHLVADEIAARSLAVAASKRVAENYTMSAVALAYREIYRKLSHRSEKDAP